MRERQHEHAHFPRKKSVGIRPGTESTGRGGRKQKKRGFKPGKYGALYSLRIAEQAVFFGLQPVTLVPAGVKAAALRGMEGNCCTGYIRSISGNVTVFVVYQVYLCLVVCDHRACSLSRMRHRHGHWVCCMQIERRLERTV